MKDTRVWDKQKTISNQIFFKLAKIKKKDNKTLRVCTMNISWFISGLNIPFMYTQLFKKIIIDEVHSFSWIWTNTDLSILARMIHETGDQTTTKEFTYIHHNISWYTITRITEQANSIIVLEEIHLKQLLTLCQAKWKMFTWLLKKGTFTLLKNIGGGGGGWRGGKVEAKVPWPLLFRRPWR